MDSIMETFEYVSLLMLSWIRNSSLLVCIADNVIFWQAVCIHSVPKERECCLQYPCRIRSRHVWKSLCVNVSLLRSSMNGCMYDGADDEGMVAQFSRAPVSVVCHVCFAQLVCFCNRCVTRCSIPCEAASLFVCSGSPIIFIQWYWPKSQGVSPLEETSYASRMYFEYVPGCRLGANLVVRRPLEV